MNTQKQDALGSRSRARTLALFLGLLLPLVGCSSFDSKPSTASAPVPPAESVQRTVISGIAGEPEIRVRIFGGTTGVRIGANSGGVVWAAPTNSSRPAARLVVPVEIRLTASEWLLTDSTGLTGRFDRITELDVALLEGEVGTGRPAGAAPAARSAGASRSAVAGALNNQLTVNGRRYDGKLRLVPKGPSPVGAFDVIEYVGLEDYLQGVVSSELYAGWPAAAFQVQAVCARSYALHERQRSRAAGLAYDLEAGVNDQAYSGASDLPSAVAAVRDTRGAVMTWNGSLLRTYYCSSSGGRAASAKDVWPTGPGYEYNLAGPLQAQTREEMGKSGKWYRWSVTRTRQELAARLKAFGQHAGLPVRNLETLDSVRVEATNNVGRPTKYRILARGGMSYTLNAEELRRACNQPVSGEPTITAETMVRSGDIEFRFVGDVVTINGRGYGHGVGVCQWSVKELADKGLDWRTIIVKFYPGAKIEKAY